MMRKHRTESLMRGNASNYDERIMTFKVSDDSNEIR